jgi:thiamine-phosphate pyrophosphorylase
MTFKLPVIYPITSRELSGLAHIEQIRQFAAAGCRFVQIREKSGSSREFYDAVVGSLTIAKEFGMTVIANDRVDVAIAAGAHGVHLGQDDLSPAIARKLLGDKAIIGYSTHSVEQAIAASAMPVDYIAVGPVFSTSTKEDPDPVIGLAGIRTIREAVGPVQIVAIGGIGLNNVAEVIAAGADSAAVISDLYLDPGEIGARYETLANVAANVKQY